jgi:hypothetical protein
MGHVREYTNKQVTGFLSNIGFKPGKVICRDRYNDAPARWSAGAFPSLKPLY